MYEWRRGSTLTIPLFDVDGVMTGSEVVNSAMQRVLVTGRPPGSGASIAATVTWVPRAGQTLGHWLMTFIPSKFPQRIGKYALDARIEYAGGVVVTPTIMIDVIESVSRASS
jgi:hypothetical protein